MKIISKDNILLEINDDNSIINISGLFKNMFEKCCDSDDDSSDDGSDDGDGSGDDGDGSDDDIIKVPVDLKILKKIIEYAENNNNKKKK